MKLLIKKYSMHSRFFLFDHQGQHIESISHLTSPNPKIVGSSNEHRSLQIQSYFQKKKISCVDLLQRNAIPDPNCHVSDCAKSEMIDVNEFPEREVLAKDEILKSAKEPVKTLLKRISGTIVGLKFSRAKYDEAVDEAIRNFDELKQYIGEICFLTTTSMTRISYRLISQVYQGCTNL